MSRLLMLCLTLLTLSACAGDNPVTEIDGPPNDSHVINGTVDVHANFPSIIAITSESATSLHCTGSLIKPDLVLTAGHCVSLYNDPAASMYLLGYDEIPIVPCPEGTCGIPGKAVGRYADYDPQSSENWNDIALVLLQHPFAGDPWTARLLDNGEGLEEGMPGVIAGYGQDNNFNSGTLISGDVIITTLWGAEMIVGLNEPDAPNACYGDSGGPVYITDDAGARWMAGVTSRVPPGESGCGHGAVYTIAGYYRDWMDDCEMELRAGGDCQVDRPGSTGSGGSTSSGPSGSSGSGGGIPDLPEEEPVVIEPSGGCAGCSTTGNGGSDLGLLLVMLGLAAPIYLRRKYS